VHLLNGQDQVLMTPQLIAPTQRQFWRYLLCGEWEARFNRNGETPALALLQRKAETDFRLLNWLNLAEPVWGDTELAAYSGSALGIDTERLAYFALSVLWYGARVGLHGSWFSHHDVCSVSEQGSSAADVLVPRARPVVPHRHKRRIALTHPGGLLRELSEAPHLQEELRGGIAKGGRPHHDDGRRTPEAHVLKTISRTVRPNQNA